MVELTYNKILASENSKKAFIFFHGWKGNKYSFKNLPSILNIKNIDWYFPEGPYSAENNVDEKSWAYQSSPGVYEIKETKQLLDDFINNHILTKYKLENVYIMGFSQGAAVCYELYLNTQCRWGGVFPVAGFLRESISKNTNKKIILNQSQKLTPILIGHGIKDDIISIDVSNKIYNFLVEKEANVNFIKYNGAHKISLNFLKKVKSIIEDEK